MVCEAFPASLISLSMGFLQQVLHSLLMKRSLMTMKQMTMMKKTMMTMKMITMKTMTTVMTMMTVMMVSMNQATVYLLCRNVSILMSTAKYFANCWCSYLLVNMMSSCTAGDPLHGAMVTSFHHCLDHAV